MRAESLFAPVLTGRSGQDEFFDATGHNSEVQTLVCSEAKGVWSVDVAAQPGRAIGRDIGRGEAVERELDAMIERRSRQKAPDEESELWRESERRYNARRRSEMRAAWTSFHEEQAERHRCTLQDLINHHETQAAKLCEGEGVGYELH